MWSGASVGTLLLRPAYVEQLGELAHESGSFSGVVGLFFNLLDVADQAGVVLGNIADVDAVQGFDFNLDGAVGLAADLFNFDEGACVIEVLGKGVIMVVGGLGNDD